MQNGESDEFRYFAACHRHLDSKIRIVRMPFKLINSLKVNNEIPVSKYISTETGLYVYISEVESPVCNAYIALGKIWELLDFPVHYAKSFHFRKLN